jgi:hypothetical protein
MKYHSPLNRQRKRISPAKGKKPPKQLTNKPPKKILKDFATKTPNRGTYSHAKNITHTQHQFVAKLERSYWRKKITLPWRELRDRIYKTLLGLIQRTYYISQNKLVWAFKFFFE